jgi:HSP20 family protein
MSTTTELKQQEPQTTQLQRQQQPTIQLRPHVDLIEQSDSFLLYAEMPGVDHSHVDVAVERNILWIRGTVEFSAPEGFRPANGNFGRRVYERHFHISDDIDRDGIEAEVKHGVLRLVLPKSQRAQRAKINVRQG